ncbi:39S ribosomal protein L14, mitochondrial-like isoform X2 [Centruroides sculpturatus]|nr:39S ribosomal protein L14, mitochondrial-like isoform X2 [Centruroides sculpturatus]XP_023218991.1 39S ribosomal protein L14, mitochondrial-like isoform X2 [Centruroides sculpturatus]
MNCALFRKTSTFVSTLSTVKFSTTNSVNHIMKMTRLRVIDNSALGKQAMLEGKPPVCIHVYKKGKPTGIGTIGDKILVAVKGQKKKAYILGVKQKQKALIPKFDSNNICLLNDDGSPMGTRITMPVPSMLRAKEGDFSKILAICTKFV